MWRTYCNRSPTDNHPNIQADLCPCGLDLISSLHYLQECPLLDSHRCQLLLSSTGDLLSPGFITNPKNFKPIREFLRATGLGHSTALKFENPANNDEDSPTDADSPEPDFATFKP